MKPGSRIAPRAAALPRATSPIGASSAKGPYRLSQGAARRNMVRALLFDKTGSYVSSAIGEADDTRGADDLDVFTYKQVFARALRWIELDP
jgi:hypothetical protein